ncbi:MAG: hypothetical protein ACE5GW_08365, partial [Planctomycetota bacterium]
MFLNPKTPLIFGSAFLGVFGVVLVLWMPLPADLAEGHASLPELSRLSGCVQCHSPKGFASGCLECHDEIETQLQQGTGFHHYLLDGRELECVKCHVEHHGAEFQVAGPNAWKELDKEHFDHPHAFFSLAGAHDALECEQCHEMEGRPPFALAGFPDTPRQHTFLGLTQECRACHEDIHAGGFSPECTRCHDQNKFRPAPFFNHDEYYELGCAHDSAKCAGCHLLPRFDESEIGLRAVTFKKARGKECLECHESPHRAKLGDDCFGCHPEDACKWTEGKAGMTPEIHRLTGFPLEKPHDKVACEKCHDPELSFEEKHPDPRAAGYRRHRETCEGCHEDVHDGQFAGRYSSCNHCHERSRFQPAHFGLKEHDIFPLKGNHAAVPCQGCHTIPAGSEVRTFVGTPRECRLCHEDPHDWQISANLREGDCDACHSSHSDTFVLHGFDHGGVTGYELVGGHARAACEDCHRKIA